MDTDNDFDFFIVSHKEILDSMFEKWLHQPDFNEIHLYQVYQKYQDYWPTPMELKEWKDKMFNSKLNIVNSVEDLNDTLDEMDEVSRKLEEFSFIVLSCQEEFKYLYDNLENIEENNYFLTNLIYNPLQFIYPIVTDFYNKIYHWTRKIINLEI